MKMDMLNVLEDKNKLAALLAALKEMETSRVR